MSKILISFCAFVMLAITPSVHADTIVITSGSVSLPGAFGPTLYSLQGQNFSITGGGSGGFASARNCTPCLPGTSLSAFTFVMGNGLGGGTVTINGTTFAGVSFLGTMELGGGGFTVPTATTDVTLTTSANLSASIFGCPGPLSPCDPPVFSTISFQGSGTATLQLRFSGFNGNGTPLFFFDSLNYRFGPEIPEPMTITLLATGLMGVGAKLGLGRIRKRKHVSGQDDRINKIPQ